MASPEKRRLIVNADDFGLSASVNAAVIRAHRDGILTTASLMVNEPACAEAVQLAQANPCSSDIPHCRRSRFPGSSTCGANSPGARWASE